MIHRGQGGSARSVGGMGQVPGMSFDCRFRSVLRGPAGVSPPVLPLPPHDKGERMIRRLAILAACAAFLAGLAGEAPAQQEVVVGPVNKAELNTGRVTVMTGGIDGLHRSYLDLAGDMASVLDQEGDLRVLPIMGRGPIENIRDLLHLQGIDVGVVHSDVLTYLKKTKTFPSAPRRLRYIAKLEDEVFHVIAHRDIASLEDLNGKRVIAGPTPAAGATVSAITLMGLLGVKPELATEDWATALEQVRKGEVAAVVYSGEAGAAPIRGLEPGEALKLLPLPIDDSLSDTYGPATLTAADYPNLLAEGETLETLQFGSVMVVYDWESDTERYQTVARFTEKLFDSLEQLRQPERNAAWQAFDPAAEVPGWTRFKPAEDWLAAHPKIIAEAQKGALTDLQTAFQTFMEQESEEAGRKLQAEDTERLFKAFLSWTDSQAEAVIPINRTDVKGIAGFVGTIKARTVEVTADSGRERALMLTPDLKGLAPGPHALRLAEATSCGAPADGQEGDLPDLVVAADGSATGAIVAPNLTLADLFGRAIVIQASDAADSAGQACGVIE